MTPNKGQSSDFSGGTAVVVGGAGIICSLCGGH